MLLTIALTATLGQLCLGPAGVVAARRGLGALVHGAGAALAGAMALVGLAALAGADAPPPAFALPTGLPALGLQFRLDPLAAWFLLVVNLPAAMAALFAIGHAGRDDRGGRGLPAYPVFVAAMSVAILADGAFTFLLGWGLMSVASWLLVLAGHRDAGGRNAGHAYLLVAGLGVLALTVAFGLMPGGDGGHGFDTMRTVPPSGWTAALLPLLVLIGVGSIAGLVPLHAWPPVAHPASPTPVPALMSGAMTKVAVYAAVRLLFDLAGPGAWWWGGALMLVGAATALIGVLHALAQGDLKRLLACSTVGSIGVVFVGLGLALAFRATDMTTAAALALGAALLHTLNHALFKTLLFLGADAVESATGRRDLDRLGGLARAMPLVGLAMLAGVAAAASLPPLNGFVSHWMLLQAILLTPELPYWPLRLAVPVIGAVTALSAALAAAAFVRAYGIGFLGRPRGDGTAAVADPPGAARGALVALAALCLLAGVLPGLIVMALQPVLAELAGTPLAGAGWALLTPGPAGRAAYAGPWLLIAPAVLLVAAAVGIGRLGGIRVRRTAAWEGGGADPSAAVPYGTGGLGQPLRRILGTTAVVERDDTSGPEADTPGDPSRDRLQVLVDALAGRADRLRPLTVRGRLGLMFCVLVMLLVGVSIWQ